MIQPFKDEADFLQWQDDKILESGPLQRQSEVYAAQCRAFDNGSQHIESCGINEKGLQGFVNTCDQISEKAGRGPARMTMNRITSQRIRNAARTNPQRFEVVPLPPIGTATPQSLAKATIYQSVANAMIEDSHYVNHASVANDNRAIDGLHGHGFRIHKGKRPNGAPDARMEAFTFDGFQLSLDPSNQSGNLCDHEWVIFTEVLTKTKAERIYGEDVFAGIKDDEFTSIQSLMPTETAFNRLSGGSLYPTLSTHAKSPGVIVRTAWLKGYGRRFDRMIITIDVKSKNNPASKKVIGDVNHAPNPYGGDGMPLGTLRGFRRAVSRLPISDVGLMIDDQRKGNMAATILFQGYWNYMNTIHVIDRNWLHNGANMSENEIWDSLDNGMIVGRGKKDAKAPAIMQAPPPPQFASEDAERWTQHMREDVFSSDVHVGKTKTHVPASTTQLAVQLAEGPLQDREEGDIKEYTRIIETMAATAVLLAKAQAPHILTMLHKSGMSADQIGTLLELDYTEHPRLKLTQNAMRRQTRSQRKDQMFQLLESQALDPAVVPMLLADIDMPMRQIDKDTSQWAESLVLKIMSGRAYKPIPLGTRVGFLLEQLQRAMMQTTDDEETQDRLVDAYQAQLEIDGLLDDPEEEEAQGEPAPEEVSLQDLVGGAQAPV